MDSKILGELAWKALDEAEMKIQGRNSEWAGPPPGDRDEGTDPLARGLDEEAARRKNSPS
jgi:hypothetical protein